MVDLHVHTKISDGSLTAVEVIKLAKEKGISCLCITDHDTTKGLKDAVDIGQEFGVKIIPGIEISAYDYKKNKRAHILGLFIDPDNDSLRMLCEPLAQMRHRTSIEMVEKIIKAGYGISLEEAESFSEGGTGVYKQHIMHALLVKGYCESIYGSLYKQLFKRGNGSDSGIAFIPMQYVDVLDAIKAVKDAGGLAVIAHPGQLGNYDSIGEWVEAGLEGIEAYHPGHNDEDIARSLKFAKEYNLAITGGSDFHGFYGETPVELGCQELADECIFDLEKRVRMSRGSS